MPSTATSILDGLSTSVAVKAPVVAVTAGNNALTGLQGYTEDDRILVWQQTTASQNGIYSASSGTWTRTKDFDGNRDVRKGTLVPVEGSAIMYRVTSSNPIVIGTSSINFEAIGPTQTQADIGALLYPRTSAEIAASVTPSDYSVPSHDAIGVILMDRYGADNAGSTAVDTALANAILVSANANHATIRFNHGQYRFTGITTIGYGIMIEGTGSQGSTEPYGTVFVHEGAGNFLVWDGNGANARGTGGGLKNILILKKTGVSGGDAVKLIATSDARRPGETLMENVLIYGQGTGLWARGLHIDGTAATTAGSKGVRSVNLNKFRVADCTENLGYIYLNQAVHFSGRHVQIDQADGTGTPGMTILGDSDNISLSDAVINGEIEVNGSSAMNVTITGHVSTLDINNTSVDGCAALSGNATLTNASPDFRIVAPRADSFAAYLSASTSNDKTGDGTDYFIIPDTELHDRNSSYDASTGVFTAKCTGLYQFDAYWTYTNLGSGHTSAKSVLLHTNAADATIRQYMQTVNPYAGSVSGEYTNRVSIIIPMAEGEKMKLFADVAGSTLTVGIKGGNTGSIFTFFSGKLLA